MATIVIIQYKKRDLSIPGHILEDLQNPTNILELNALITAFTEHYKNIINVRILKHCKTIYSYRRDDLTYCCRRNYPVTYCHNKYCIVIERSKLIQGFKLTFMYDVAGVDAERSIVLPQLVQLIMQDQGLTIENLDYVSIGLIKNEQQDLYALRDATSRGYNVYVSALGTALTLYLADLYFNKAPQGIYHVNCFSTAVALFGLPNLIRLFPPDSFNPPIFVKLSTQDIVLMYESTSLWATSLAKDITTQALGEGKNVTNIPVLNAANPDGYISVLAALPASSDPHSVIVLSNSTLVIVENIRTSGVLEDKFPFQFLFGDAAADTPVTTPEMVAYLQLHDTIMIQPLLTNADLLLAVKLNVELHNPDHPVTQNVALLYGCIDVALLLRDMPLEKRSERKRFVLTLLDKNGDNANGYYSGVKFVGVGLYSLYLIALVNSTQLFIGYAN